MFTKEQILEAKQTEAVQMIRSNMAESNWWAVRGMLAIYAKQTADEQQAETVTHDNGVGFTGTDGHILSSFAKQVNRWMATAPERRQYDFPLSVKQTAIVQKKMPKYAGQLLKIAKVAADNAAEAAIEQDELAAA
jgi:hypothetical protein